jgi:hypothetical protein
MFNAPKLEKSISSPKRDAKKIAQYYPTYPRTKVTKTDTKPQAGVANHLEVVL